jgi:hypothetical protein
MLTYASKFGTPISVSGYGVSVVVAIGTHRPNMGSKKMVWSLEISCRGVS